LALVCNTAKSNWEVVNDTLGSDHFPTMTSLNEITLFPETIGPKQLKMSKGD